MDRFLFYIYLAVSRLLVRAKTPPYYLTPFIVFILRNVLGYRKKVITDNLMIAFPEKDEAAIASIRNAFYKQLATTFTEVLYTYSHPDKLATRVSHEGFESIDQHLAAGQSVMLCAAHLYNWEWVGITSSLAVKHPVMGVYKPLSNPHFEEHLHAARSSLGVLLVPMRTTMKMIAKRESMDQPTLYILGADQSPSHTKKSIWVDFFGKKTPFFPGIQNLVVKYDMPVYYMDINCPKRGYYHVKAIKMESSDGNWMEPYARMVESSIRRVPHAWLWSHRRWKHSFED